MLSVDPLDELDKELEKEKEEMEVGQCPGDESPAGDFLPSVLGSPGTLGTEVTRVEA